MRSVVCMSVCRQLILYTTKAISLIVFLLIYDCTQGPVVVAVIPTLNCIVFYC